MPTVRLDRWCRDYTRDKQIIGYSDGIFKLWRLNNGVVRGVENTVPISGFS